MIGKRWAVPLIFCTKDMNACAKVDWFIFMHRLRVRHLRFGAQVFVHSLVLTAAK